MSSLINVFVIATLLLQGIAPISILSVEKLKIENPIEEPISNTLVDIADSAPLFSDQITQEISESTKDDILKLDINASPQLVFPGETFTISWNFSSMPALTDKAKAADDLSFELNFPTGITSVSKLESLVSKDGTTSFLSMVEEVGSATLMVAKDAELPLVVDVAVRSGEDVIAFDSVLISSPSFQMTAGNASSFTTNDGKVKLEFSPSTSSENLLMDIRDAGPSNDRGYSLSGLPVEILAVSEKSRTNITQFNDLMRLTIKYDPEKIFDWAEEDLSLFYFDETTLDWWPVATMVNTETNELTALVDHLTVFDYRANSWQGSRTPTVDGAQVSSYTGAGTYNMSFWTPPAPGGFQPTLSLDYNSQVIDNSTAFTQASWVGMGWTLDTGYIERNMNGTNSNLADDTFSMLLGGSSTQLLPINVVGNVTTYAAKNINYWTIEFDSSTGNWTVYDQVGTTYYFNDQAKTHTTNGCVSTLAALDLVWRWSLSSSVDKFGNSINYTYAKQSKTASCLNQVAVYPQYITYPNGQYRIAFLRQARTDYQSAWEATDSKTFFSNERLDKIQVQRLVDGAWTNIRQYDFSYADGASNQIYPPFTWTKGGKTTTLVGVQELSGNGASVLPATTFSYSDYMHVTNVNNGQGGGVAFTYERWHYLDDINKDIRHILTTFGDYGQECSSGYGTVWYAYNGYGTTKCEAAMLQIDKRSSVVGISVREFPQHMIKPGGHYRMFLQVRNIYQTTGVEWGFIDGYHGADIEGIYNGIGTAFVYPEFGGEMPVLFDPNNTKMIIECDNCYVKKVDFALMPLYYRVTTQTISDSVTSRNETYAFNYDEPSANDNYHSAVASKTSDLTKYYVAPMRDYRGNAMTMITNPGGLLNTTWFYQNDLLAGSPYRTLVSSKDLYDGFETFNTSNWIYSHQGTRQIFTGLNGDSTLINTNPAADWTSSVSRTGNTLTNGDVMVAQFNLSGGNTQNEMGITNSAGDFFGLIVQPSGTSDYVKLRTRENGSTSDTTTLIPETSFKRGTWYVVMIFVDANDDFHIRVWEKSNPEVYGEASSLMNGATAWHFQQKTYNGTVYLDTYLEGVPYSETETSYTTSVLYDTDTATTSIPDIAGSGLMNFVDLTVNRTYANTSISRFFDKDYSFNGTRTTFEYNPSDQGSIQYGNLTRKVESSWNGSQWVDYRASKTVYNPNPAAHLTMLPARTIAQECSAGCDFSSESGKIAESIFLYDNSGGTWPSQGKLTNTRTWISGPNYSQIDLAYDAHGNQSGQTTYTGYGTADATPSSSGSTTSTLYDPTYFTYPVSTTNPLHPATVMTYDYSIGLPTSVSIPDNLNYPNYIPTEAQYDVFGRMVKIIAQGDSVSSPTLAITYYDTRIPFQVDLKQKVNDSSSIRISHFYNGLGGLSQTQTVGAVVNGTLQNVVVDTQFDTLNRQIKNTKPYNIAYNASPAFQAQTFSQPATQTTYDLINRPISVTEPNSTAITYGYSGLWTSVTDPAQNTTFVLKDDWGHTVLVDSPTGPDLSYNYDTRDQLIAVQKGAGAAATTTVIGYDQAGRKVGMLDPDMGTWVYGYDAVGNLISQTDARSCTTTLSYDALNRLTGKSYSGSPDCPVTAPTSYTYDIGVNAVGHRSSMADGTGTTSWTFDTRGRTLSETKLIQDETLIDRTFVTSWTYNSADQPVTMTYPDGEVLTYGYDSQGSQITLANNAGFNYLTGIKYDEAGRITQIKLGNSNLLSKNFSYFGWAASVNGGRLNNMSVTNSSNTTLQNLSYLYDSRGNINQITDSIANEVSTFSYDALSRLTSMNVANSGNTIPAEVFVYDEANGNLSAKGTDSNNLVSYTYDPAKPHAVVGFNGNQYAYDANGNQITREINGNTFSLTYNGENKLIKVESEQAFADENTSLRTMSSLMAAESTSIQVLGQCGPFTTASQTVTIPDETTLLVVVEGGGNHTFPTTYTVGDQPLTREVNASTSYPKARIYYRNLPPTGSQTISLNGFAPGSGAAWGCYFLSGTNTTSPIYRSNWTQMVLLNGIAAAPISREGDLVIDVLGTRNTPTYINYGCSESAGYTSLSSRTASAYKYASDIATSICYSHNGGWSVMAYVVIQPADEPPPTPTPTATQTATLTTTATSTETPTVTITETSTATDTETPTLTDTLTATATDTVTPTLTETVTATDTETPTPADTSTATQSMGSGNTETPTDTPTVTSTSTDTPTVTPTETLTPTVTDTPTATDTPTLTVTPSETPTETVTLTPTPTETSTPTVTSTPTLPPPGGIANYFYDGDGNLVKSVIDGKTTYYPAAHYELRVVEGVETTFKYYFAGSARIAMRQNEVITWLFSDNLSSTSLVVDANGLPVSSVKYTAFGEIRSGSAPTDYLYTGQRNEIEIGLDYYVARFYDPALGRFTQADTIIPNPASVKSYDRYAYSNNNPINYSDPSGNRECDYRCQMEYQRVDPSYEHYGEALSTWNVAAQRKNEKTANAILDGLTQYSLNIAVPPIGLFYQYITDQKVTKLDIVFALFPGGAIGGLGEGVMKAVVKNGDEVIKLTGQMHHIFSSKILNALNKSDSLKGVFHKRDLIVQAADQASHIGYQTWHRLLDDEVVNWIKKASDDVKPQEFLNYMLDLYSTTDLEHRFPEAVNLITNLTEAIK